jgi:hypothetical protein
MTIRELIALLEQLDPEIEVVGESETSMFDLVPEDFTLSPENRRYRPKEKVLVIGYSH